MALQVKVPVMTTVRAQCSAFAKTKGSRCKRRPLPGSSYCIVHVEKMPLIASALVGAVLSLAASVLWNEVVPSRERVELQSLKTEIQPVLELAKTNAPRNVSDKDALAGLVPLVSELKNTSRVLQEEMAPFREIARQRYPNVPPDSALHSLQSDLSRLQIRTEALEEKAVAEDRAKQFADQQKKTAPNIEANLAVAGSQKVRLILESKNLIPFEILWRVVTLNSKIVGGIPLDWKKIYPTTDRHTFYLEEEIDFAQIVDNYLELRLNYRSIYAEEMNLPGLSGYLAQKYRLSEDRHSLIRVDKQ